MRGFAPQSALSAEPHTEISRLCCSIMRVIPRVSISNPPATELRLNSGLIPASRTTVSGMRKLGSILNFSSLRFAQFQIKRKPYLRATIQIPLQKLPRLPAIRYDKTSTYMLRFETAGESHGECLVAILTGLPAGVPVSVDAINHQLWRRQQGYGRGGRMKIETDRAQLGSGVRHSRTIGTPIAILLENKDWKNSTEALPVEDVDGGEDKKKPVTRPRPGHADLAGALKYNFHDARYILERASARETAARVAAGALPKALLGEFGGGVLSHGHSVG